MWTSPTFEQLLAMTDAEVRAKFDKLAESTQPGLGFWRDELFRRQLLEESKRTADLNKWMLVLTVANVVVAVVAAVAAVAALAS